MEVYILVIIALASWLVSYKLKSKFKHYSKLYLQNGMSGAEIAQKMLSDHGIRDVRVISTPGRLTDHYNRKHSLKTVYTNKKACGIFTPQAFNLIVL